ncbi:MAG: Asp-tRNA(Asn)/Glu-tRNA(Gln) amidotransferase subunit GatC [bacterium]
MAKIDKELVKYVAALSRLEFDEAELEVFTEKFKKILEYVEQLGNLDVEDVAPTYHVLPQSDVMREDEEKPSMDTEEVLKNAPQRSDDFFKVPRVVD